MAYLVNKNDSDMIDELVIDSEWCASCFDKAMVYDGHLLKTGSPRCDVLYGDRQEQKLKFRKKHNLPDNAKVSGNFAIDHTRFIEDLKSRI